MKVLTKYFSKHKWKIALYLFMYIVFYGLTIYSSLVLADYLTSVTDNLSNHAWGQLVYLIVILALIYTSHYILYMIGVIIAHNMMLDLKKDLMKALLNINSLTLTNASTGRLVSRVASDPDLLVEKLETFVSTIANAISYFATLCILIVINVWVGLISVAFLLAIAIFELIRAKSNKKYRKLEKEANDEAISFTNEIVRSEKDIKGQHLERGLNEIAVGKFKKKCNIYKHRHFKSITLWYIRCLATVAYIGVLLYVGMVLLKSEAIVLANFIFIFTNREALQNVVWQYSNIILDYGEIKILSDRMFEITNGEMYPAERFGDKEIENFKGNIRFENVNFEYKDGKRVLNDINFEISENQFVAFVGKSGCGKSTLLGLISKIYEVGDGKILIDEENINELSKSCLRDNINFLNQFPYIFNLTIRENMKLINPDASDEQIIRALQEVDLWEYIENMDKGLDTIVGENGVNFSGGQKQRLTIARSFLKDSKIMLFDESTSSLDNIAQEKIISHIEENRGNKTIIMVAHRLTTIRNVDKIFFIENGTIVDSGTFEQLVDRNENFKKIFKSEI